MDLYLTKFSFCRYCLFGELFEEAIRGGLPAVQTMHPGYYYEQAAKHTLDRKAAAAQLCQVIWALSAVQLTK